MTRGGPIPAVPRNLVVYLIRSQDIALHFQGTLANAEEAKGFADSINQLVQKGLEALQNLPPEIKIKPDSLRLLSTTLGSVKMEAKALEVQADVEIPGDVLKVLDNLVTDFATSAAKELPTDVRPPPPPLPAPPPPPR